MNQVFITISPKPVKSLKEIKELNDAKIPIIVIDQKLG